MGFLGGSVVKNLPANAGDMDQSQGQKDPLEGKMATYYSILAWETPGTEEPEVLQSLGSQKRNYLTTIQQQQTTKTTLAKVSLHY